MFRFKARAVLSSIFKWLTNRRIVWIAVAIAFLGFAGPGLFGLSPPRFFHGHDAGTQQAKTDELPPGNHSASDMSPQVAQPDASPEIVAVPEASRDDDGVLEIYPSFWAAKVGVTARRLDRLEPAHLSQEASRAREPSTFDERRWRSSGAKQLI